MSFRRVGSARPAWIAAMVLCVGFPGIALAQTPAAPLPPCPADPFVGQTELSAEQLVAEVLARNPSLQAMNAAWRAAAERCPQVISLDDPMFGFLVSTAHVGMNDPEDGWMVEASQRVPWMGKRALRGESASAEAQAAASEAGDTRLRLVEAGRIALYDYYQARRQLEVNRGITELMSGFREVARTRYEASQATEQDVLMADVELGDLQTRKAELGREETIAVARINTLLHREAGYPLPAPPQQLDEPVAPPQIELLHGVALTRPDLAARAARVRAEEAAVELAHKEFMPDLDFVARYDTSMADPKMRPVLGMNLNVPVQRSRRWAAVREACARLEQRRAEYQQQLDQVRLEVQSAWARTGESWQVVRLYRDRIVPLAETSVQSARANYTTGRVDFLRLLEAERQLRNLRERYYQAAAEYHRRTAELERVAGGSLPR